MNVLFWGLEPVQHDQDTHEHSMEGCVLKEHDGRVVLRTDHPIVSVLVHLAFMLARPKHGAAHDSESLPRRQG